VGPLIDNTGLNTLTCIVLLDAHPFAVPCTVYTVVPCGVSFIPAVVAPVFQLYVLAPEAVKVTFVPPHTSVFDALIDIVGLELVNTTWFAQVVHPKLFVPATEYKVGAVGIAV
jgi:hypothetical protein